MRQYRKRKKNNSETYFAFMKEKDVLTWLKMEYRTLRRHVTKSGEVAKRISFFCQINLQTYDPANILWSLVREEPVESCSIRSIIKTGKKKEKILMLIVLRSL